VAVADVQLEEKAKKKIEKKNTDAAHLGVVAVAHVVLLEEEVAV
jgi:hypothetical protein